MSNSYKSIRLLADVEAGKLNITSERAGTHQREQYLSRLSEAFAGGYLNDEELHARQDAAHHATTVEELQFLARDLPAPEIQPVKLAAWLQRLSLWRHLGPVQRLSFLIGTAALSLVTIILPIALVTGARETYPIYLGAPIGIGGFFLGLTGLIISIIVACTDRKIIRRFG